MSLIPFILDLADELQEYQRCLFSGGSSATCSAMDVDDVEVSLQQNTSEQQESTAPQPQPSPSQSLPQQQQQQPQQQQTEQQRRPRLLSQLYWPTNVLPKQHSHHPHNHAHHQHGHLGQRHHPYAQTARLCCSKDSHDTLANLKSNAISGLTPIKPTTYPIINKNGWMMVSMNVKQFTPDELIVKTIDNCIIVEGRHEDKADIHGVISRHFIRKYMLPKGYDPNEVVSTLSSDGILTVKAPPPQPPKTDEEPQERFVDIQQQQQQQQQTGPAQMAAKQTAPTPILQSPTEAAPTPTPTTPPPSKSADAETAAPVAADEINSSNETPAAVQQEEQKAAAAISEIEPSTINNPLLEATATNDTPACNDKELSAATAAMECTESDGVDVAKKLDEIPAAAAIEELLAESAKPEMQVDVNETAVMLADTNAAAVGVDAVTAVPAAAIVGCLPLNIGVESIDNIANNGDDVDVAENTNETKTTDKHIGEKNGIDAIGIVDAQMLPVIKNAIANILPTDVPTSLDLNLSVPKSFVIETAVKVGNAAVADDVADVADAAMFATEKNGVDASNGTSTGSTTNDDVVADNGVVVGLAAIDALSNAANVAAAAAAEELVAN